MRNTTVTREYHIPGAGITTIIFTGRDSDIDIESGEPEFLDWRWVEIETLPDLIVPFKRQLYRDLVAEFGPLARRPANER